MAINKNLASAKYFYDNNDLEAAKKICESVLNNNNKSLEALNLITLINIKKENFGEALKYLNLIIQIDDKNYEAFFKKAMILQRLKKSEEALQNLDSAISLNKNQAELFNLKAILFTISFEEILNRTSDSTKLFSFRVLPDETKSTIVEQIPSFGANSIAPFNFIHSALIPLFAK